MLVMNERCKDSVVRGCSLVCEPTATVSLPGNNKESKSIGPITQSQVTVNQSVKLIFKSSQIKSVTARNQKY